jgi:hypothetical protein
MVSSGPVSADGKIGTIACETCAGGFATGPHVHFSLLYNGAYVDLEGAQLSGWTVRSGKGDYVTGGLERNGLLLSPYSSVLNEGPGAVEPPLTPTPTASPSAASAAYLHPPSNGLIRICPVTLVAEATAPGGVGSVVFWAKPGSDWKQIGLDADGSDGWQTEWDCEDAPDGAATLSLSVIDEAGREGIRQGAATPVTIRKDCVDGAYRTAFFANPALAGAPASSWCKASAVAYNWGLGSPGAGVPGTDNFSARFRGNFWFDGGAYRFAGEFDDGVRVWVDRALLVDSWIDRTGSPGRFAFTRALSPGLHEVRLDYYERTGTATVRLNWQRVNSAAPRSYLPLVLRAAP